MSFHGNYKIIVVIILDEFVTSIIHLASLLSIVVSVQTFGGVFFVSF